MSPSIKQSKAICILGMHRSGTSTVSRVINLLGAYLGEDHELGQAAPDNPEGFWERLDIVEVHNGLLANLRQRWDSAISLPEGWHRALEVSLFRDKLRSILSTAFARRPLWAWKDPRTCLLMPLWRDLLAEADTALAVAYVIRNPVDVANSLSKRNNFPIEKSYGIWLNYNLSALKALAGVPLIFVSYDSLLDDPERQMQRLSQGLSIPWPADETALKVELAGFLRQDLRHSKSAAEALHGAPQLVKDLYGLLVAAAEDRLTIDAAFFAQVSFMAEEVRERSEPFRWDTECHFRNESFVIPELRAEADKLQRTLDQLREVVVERDQQLVELDQQLAERDQQLAELVRQLGERYQQLAGKNQQLTHKQLEIKELHASLSWRITKPLRSTLDKLTNSPMTKPLLRKANKVLQQATVNSTQIEPRGPSLEELNRHDPLAVKAIAAQRDSYDVIVFPVIDWHFRVQRPQHLASNLAALGHRVFYLTTTFSHEWQQPGFRIIESPAADVFIVQLNIPLPHPANIYQDTISADQQQFLIAALEQLRHICHIRQTVSVVDLPFWRPVVEGLSGNLVIYDCMDHHAGFSTNDKQMLLEEKHLLSSADLVIVSSQRLSEIVGQERENVIIRNGADVAMFAQRPTELAHTTTRSVVGYYGAISEWFDMDLLIAAAKALPDWDFVLVGSTFGCNVGKAEKIPNIIFTGEVPYASLPKYLYAFDVCTIPFLLTELTLCTNPVKVYEYLSAGKPVVTSAMPELQLIRDQLHIAESAPEFIEKLKIAMTECNDTTLAGQRATWAQQHDWRARAEALDKEIQPFYPKASVIVLTYNNINLTKACLESLNTYTAYPDWELIIVDNASADGTPAYLQEFAAHHENATVILNDANLGFAAGNNVGMNAATGDYLVILNNDTVVTNGWLFNLIRHLRRDPSLGLVGPVTNSIGNEAQIETNYQSMEEMRIAAWQYTSAHARKLMHARNVAFFCVALRREVMERVGLLDEAFTVGFFEDDDYCRRIHGAGLSIAIAEDVFVHHEHSASFNALAPERKKEIFEKNKKVYEAKWGEWVPHVYR